jgi:hypothetical protein
MNKNLIIEKNTTMYRPCNVAPRHAVYKDISIVEDFSADHITPQIIYAMGMTLPNPCVYSVYAVYCVYIKPIIDWWETNNKYINYIIIETKETQSLVRVVFGGQSTCLKTPIFLQKTSHYMIAYPRSLIITNTHMTHIYLI